MIKQKKDMKLTLKMQYVYFEAHSLNAKHTFEILNFFYDQQHDDLLLPHPLDALLLSAHSNFDQLDSY